MREEGEVGAQSRAMAGGDHEVRRSPRLMRKEELSACASEQDLILKLKEEARALRALQEERLVREGHLVDPAPPKAQPAGKMKRKKVVKRRVPRKQIEYKIQNRRRSPFEGICEDLELGKRSQRFRELYAERMAIVNKHYEYEDALIKQFRTKGYADDYSEVTDDDDDD